MVHICIIQNKVHCSGNNINTYSLREVWDSHILCNRISSLVNISILNIAIPCNYIWSQRLPLLLSNTTSNTLIRLICNKITINHRSLREKCGLIFLNKVHSMVHVCIIQNRVHCNGSKNNICSLREVWDIHMR